MPAAIAIQESDDVLAELTSLHKWLSGSFAGAVSIERPKPGASDLGAFSDLVSVALGSGGAVTALAGSLATWLVSRRSHIKIRITGPGGRTAEVDVKQAKGDRAAVESLLRELLSEPGDGDP